MGTIIINGKRFVGGNVAVSNGKVVIDGNVQDEEIQRGVEVRVMDEPGTAECFASVTRSEQSVAGIRATAIATAGGSRKGKRQ